MSVANPLRPLSPWWRDPATLVELFLAANLAFLAVDILIAHSINAFARPAEWIPIEFSAAATLALVFCWLLNGGIRPVPRGSGHTRHTLARRLGCLVGWGSIAVGVAGLIFHLESQFFRERTIHSLVYTAPFAAPLAYSGLGLLAILNRSIEPRSREWAAWVIVLALGGFVGNFVLCVADHAQNGFYHPAEWAGVIAAAFGISSLTALLAVPDNRPLSHFAGIVLLAQMLVGLAGFAYHVSANLARPGSESWDNFIHGAPAFAPLLFPNLAALAFIGLWSFAPTQAIPSPLPAHSSS